MLTNVQKMTVQTEHPLSEMPGTGKSFGSWIFLDFRIFAHTMKHLGNGTQFKTEVTMLHTHRLKAI